MNTRQATKVLLTTITLLTMYACTPASPPVAPSQVQTIASQTPQPTQTTAPLIDTATATPLTCLTETGRVDSGRLESTNPPQEYLIYLPPCYDQKTEEHYPVLYLLHGQTYTQDQWVRLGAVEIIDRLIQSGESLPFIVVFPDDRYWNLPPGPGFGQRLIELIIPYIDENYRTLDDRDQRAIGGMSRGAGWALRLGLTRWDLFSSIGLHSLAISQKDVSQLDNWLADIPDSSKLRVYMDIGDNDPELTMAGNIEAQFNEYGLLHEWHLYSGGHTEEYWSAHVEEYIQWYAAGWNKTHPE
ncbi:MAG TPA: alpha/beta hydrolase-fold protein [Anaerolineales bacterium]|nr:alpha/beta hydrolase-fold protein [Anaerolineales bacterium]